ncbi:DNAJC3 [Bugula neritina]|uniref:DNAJC3 n=1 Tax=Bugula neritina TaxID=10212 RepID=A0A7J7K6G4_BUGNE|nr:DNAJC3 [Bugula neritina]
MRNEGEWDDCVTKAKSMLKTESHVHPMSTLQRAHLPLRRRVCVLQAGYKAEAVKSCNEVLTLDSHSVDALCDLADLYILDQDYETGVPRNAPKKDILKAYRKLAMVWHPDKFELEEEKKEAEKKFMDIAAAKEVLTDPEARQKFDNGEDPLDPEQQQGQGGHGHPFFHGFNPFGSGGSFKFHFN